MKLFRIIAAGATAAALAGSAFAAGGAAHPHGPEGGFPFEGPLGKFEMDSVQRGYQVYSEVCASCHSMKLLSYRNLGEKGGPFYDPDYPNANDNPLVKAFAAQNEILDTVPNDIGEYDYRPARPSDAFRSPYANDAAAAAANGGAIPPDLSVITKARHGGASYIYSLMTGYPEEEAILGERLVSEASDGGTPDDPSDDTFAVYVTMIDPAKVHGSGLEAHGDTSHHESVLLQNVGQYYNPYMPGDTTPSFEGDPRHPPAGGFLAMPPQLADGRVEYLDGTEATVEQMAYDVAQFLAWAGEPKQQNRKSLGLATIAYLVFFAILLWLSYKRIWRNVDH